MKLAIRQFLFSGGGISPAAAMLALFEGAGDDAGVFQESGVRFLAQHLGSGRYASWRLTNATVGLSGFEERFCILSVNQDAATFSGAWEHLGGNGYNNSYSRTSTTGAYVQWTTPANVSEIGAWSLLGTLNSGIHLVTIDGDTTLANRLPTAQDLVDAGTLDSTALVANGGTLNPTDRVWDQYGLLTPHGSQLLAIDLPPSAHTVRITVTGYKRAASSSTRLYISGTFAGGRSITMSTANVSMWQSSVVSNLESRAEYALNFKPDGATNFDFVGHSLLSSGAYSDVIIDGVSTTLADGEVKGCATSAAIVSTMTHTHPDTGATQVAHGETTWTIRPTSGLTIEWDLTWDVAGTASTGYAAMLPLSDSVFTKGSNIASNQDWTLNADDSSFVANEPSDTVYVWGENWAGLLYLPSLSSVNNFALCTSEFHYIQDRTGGLINKIYATRQDEQTPVAEDEQWTSEANYRVQWFADADAELTRE